MNTTENIVMCAALAAVFCSAGYGAVEWQDDIPAFRQGVDDYRIAGTFAHGDWSDGVFFVSVTNHGSFYMDYNRYPGMKPFRGAKELVLETELGELSSVFAELFVAEFPKGESKPLRAQLGRETRFKANLDVSKRYQLRGIAINCAGHGGKPWKVGFRSLRGVFESSKADALSVEAETGNPLHIVREGKGENPVLVVRNASRERIAAHGVLKAKDFSGGSLDVPVDVALEGGMTAEIPITASGGARLRKSVWKIEGRLAVDDGSEVKVDTRFAVMDLHERTPKQPRGTYRMGINWHIARFTPEDRKLTADAMVACGAKLTRTDMASMSMIQGKGPDCWDFSRTDSLMDTMEESGISMDTIIFSMPRWAAPVERRTNSNWRVWAMGAPMPGLFELFCERLASRYGTRIDYYEIGNEWDLFCFYGTFEDAVAVQREAYTGLKRGCPDVCVIPNGWTAGGDSPLIVKSGRPGLHEYFLKNAKEYFDIHPIHGHQPFASFAKAIKEDFFFPLRRRTGVEDKPWYSNEAGYTSTWSERIAAITVWKKILWAWANGSVDYIWYNLKGTGWNPKDSEQGFGIITADFRPRDAYVAFAALATLVGGGRYVRTVVDDGQRYCYEFAKGGHVVLVAWDQSGSAMSIPVATDASGAWLVDLMGNRTALPRDKRTVDFPFTDEPRALVLDGATFAKPDAAAARSVPRDDAGVVVIRTEGGDRKPDFALEKIEQVHNFFAGAPNEVGRLWKGAEDNSAKVWLSKDERGLRIRVDVTDDVHSQPFSGYGQYAGDDLQVALGIPGQKGHWEFGFARRDDGQSDVHCWYAPGGFAAEPAAAKVELKTSRTGAMTRYDALVPYCAETGLEEKALDAGFRFNLMVNDNDGDGRDATIEIVPETFSSKEILLAPVVRFAAPTDLK